MQALGKSSETPAGMALLKQALQPVVDDFENELEKRIGFDPGPIDGIKGTKAAVRAFQRLHGLKPDGIPGPRTLAELFPEDIPERHADHPLWPGPHAPVLRCSW
jgi:hypothetical protein